MRYRQVIDDQRIRFVDDDSSRAFSSCMRLLAPAIERPALHVVTVTTRRECIADDGRRAAAARERMMELAA